MTQHEYEKCIAATDAKRRAPKVSAEENLRRMNADFARTAAIEAAFGDPFGDESTVDKYVEHEQALQEHEGKKVKRLQIMLFAQRVRARFLSLSMADRKIFLDVLTADEGGAMTRMFALQAQVASEITDDQLALAKMAAKPANSDLAATIAVCKLYDKQTRSQERQKKLRASSSRPALPAGRALSLTGGDRDK